MGGEKNVGVCPVKEFEEQGFRELRSEEEVGGCVGSEVGGEGWEVLWVAG